MGMFGKIGGYLQNQGKYLMSREGLQDIAASLGDLDNGTNEYAKLQEQRALDQKQVQVKAQQQALLQLLTGPSPSADNGSSGPPAQGGGIYNRLQDPKVQAALSAAALGGNKGIGDIIAMSNATRPDLQPVNGFMVNTHDAANTNRYLPEAPAKGSEPMYNQQGQQVGWRMQDGSLQAMQQAAQAGQLGQTMGSMQTVQMADGTSRMMTGADFLNAQQGGGMPGLGVKPSDAQQVADRTIAQFGATAQTALPDVMANAGQIIASAKNLASDPNLKDRLGFYSMLPAIPNTPGVGVDAKIKQLTGMGFLSVYQQLRGAGAITEQEGQKATEAWARLNQAQSENDFRQALKDVTDITQMGMQRMQQKASMSPAAGQPGAMMQRPQAMAPRTQMGRSRIIAVESQ